MPRVFKTAFNGGRIGPSLQWRSDLQLHGTANKELLNWIPEIGGSVTRRPGARNLLEFEPGLIAGVNSIGRHFDFQYGEQDFDTVFFYAVTPTTPAILSIYNSNGSRVARFDGDDVPYVGSDLKDLNFIQSFDALYIFSANHPTKRLTRRSETDWRLLDHQYNGGPWKIGNGDRGTIVSGDFPRYEATTTYNTGDVVLLDTEYALSGISGIRLVNLTSVDLGNGPVFVRQYHTSINVTAITPDLRPGVKVTISGAVVAGSGASLNGVWEVATACQGCGYVELITSTYVTEDGGPGSEVINDYRGNDLSAATLSLKGQRQIFYTSLVDSNTGNDPDTPESDFWRPSASYSGRLTLISPKPVWSADDVGRSFRISAGESPRITGTFLQGDEGEVSDTIPAQGQVTLTTEGGIWDGEIALQLSIDSGVSWEDIGVINSEDGTRNGTITRTITDFGALVRAYMRERNGASGDTGCKYYITLDDQQYNYLVIEEFVSENEVVVQTRFPISTVPSSWRWNESAFGASEGYPANAVVLDDTLIVSGVPGSPGTVYFSNLGDWTNWVTGGYTGSAFEVVLGKDTRNVVQWMRSRESLLIGTDAGEWTIAPRDAGLSLSLTNYKIERQAEYGSEAVPALPVGDVVVYVERGSFRIRALEGSIYDRGTFKSVDISFKVPDFFETSQVRQMAFLRSPVPSLWVLMEDERLYSWSFDTTNGVSAWAEHDFGASAQGIYSISATPSSAGDVLLVSAKRVFEIILMGVQYGNDHLDGLTVYEDTNTNTFYYYSGAQELGITVYDSAYIENPNAVFAEVDNFNPFLRFLKLISPVPDLVIYIDGEVVNEEEQYIRLGSFEKIFAILERGTVTVYDGFTELTEGVDYSIESPYNCAYLKLTPDAPDGVDWGDLDIRTISPDAVIPVTEYVIQSDNSLIIQGEPSSNVRLVYNDPVEGLRDLVPLYEYFTRSPAQGFAMVGFANEERASRVTVGYPQENLIWPVDPLANMQLGGPGSTVSFDQVDLLVKNSLGLQIKGANEEDWTSVPDVTPTDVVGEALPLYTGVQRVDFSSDTQYNGVDIQIRANGPRSSTICSMAVDVKRKN